MPIEGMVPVLVTSVESLVVRRSAFVALVVCTLTTIGNATTLTTLATFNGANGKFPIAGLIASGNTLYGTASSGTNDSGSVFSLSVNGGPITTLVSFTGANGSGFAPTCALTLSGSTLYGTTYSGGTFYPNGSGTVFSVPVTGGALTTLARFNGANGTRPLAGLLFSGNTLYGTTDHDGVNTTGRVFSLPATGGSPTTLATFTSGVESGLAGSSAGLVLRGNTLYGTTRQGGAYGRGTIFSVPVSGGALTTLATFDNTNGAAPFGDLILYGDTIYGTTVAGGANNEGTVFSLPITGGEPTTLATFHGITGSGPAAGVTLSGNYLFGTTSSGGASNRGTIFAVPIAGGAPTTLVNFNGANGSDPEGELLLVGNTLYGTTARGGVSGAGSVFALHLATPGDFDGNFVVNALDIDLLYAATAGATPSPASALYDVNGDGVVSKTPNTPGSDVDYLVRGILHADYGDANLDQRVDFDDLLVLAQNYNSPTGGWASGNFDGDPGVSFGDLLLLAQRYGLGAMPVAINGGFNSDWQLAVSIAPEPSVFGGFASIGAIMHFRRRTTIGKAE